MTVVFLDEIWKAGPSIQNTLLTILNEKIYRNGDKEEKVDIRAIISASNELPEQNQGLEALWDRFLIRYLVNGIENIQNFNEMITKPLNGFKDNINKELKIKDEEYEKWSKEIDNIQVPNEVLNVIKVIRIKLHKIKEKDKQIYISDRRWRKIVRILRTSAFLNNRKSVDLMDCFLIAHCIWNKPEQFENIKEIVAKSIKKYGYSYEIKSNSIKQAIKEFEQEVIIETVVRKKVLETKKELINSKYYEILKLDNYYHYSHPYILKADYDNLNTKDLQPIHLYDSNGKKKHTINAKKDKNEITIIIETDEYENENKTFNFKTIEVEKEQETTKKPNHRLVKEWNKLVNQIKSDIGREISKAEKYRKEQLKHLQTNLFVDRRLSQYVEGNIIEAINNLKQLKLKVEKIKHFYETIK